MAYKQLKATFMYQNRIKQHLLCLCMFLLLQYKHETHLAPFSLDTLLQKQLSMLRMISCKFPQCNFL